jgi:hypothetical protein
VVSVMVAWAVWGSAVAAPAVCPVLVVFHIPAPVALHKK